MSSALVVLANGFEDIEAVTAIDVLRRGGVDVVTASIHDGLNVEAAHGIMMRADEKLADVADRDFDAIVLPGGGLGTENLKKCEAVLDLVRRQKDGGRLVCAICAAPTVLAAAEVVDERRHVTCYPSCKGEMPCRVADVPVIEDDGIITGQAPGAALLFALVVLKALEGERMARRVANGMVTDLL